MTAASPGPQLFSILNTESYVLVRSRKGTFLLSFVGQAALLGIIIDLTSRVVSPPEFRKDVSDLAKLPLVFSGFKAEAITIACLRRMAARPVVLWNRKSFLPL